MKSEFPILHDPGVHEIKISEALNCEINDDKLKGLNDIKFIFICFTNRSGSNWLGELLANALDMNSPGEPLNFTPVLNHANEKGFTNFLDYFLWLVEKKSKNNVFITKISWDQLFFLTKIGLIPKIKSNSKFIHIERKNKLEQAVSFSIALQNNKWTSEQKSIETEIEYKEDQIINIIRANCLSRSMFDQYFEIFNIPYFHLYYEGLYKNTSILLIKVFKYLNMPHISHNVKTENKLKIQRDSLNFKFIKKFRLKYSL